MKSISIIIYEGNETKVKQLQNMMNEYQGEYQMSTEIHVVNTLDKLEFALKEKVYHVIVADTVVNGINIMDEFQKLRDTGYKGEIIFLTEDRESIYQSFQVKAFYYGIYSEMNEDKIKKVLHAGMDKAYQTLPEILYYKGEDGYKSLDVKSVEYVCINDKIINCVGKTVNEHIFWGKIGEFEDRLKEVGFLRVHRSYIVRQDSVHIVEKNKLWLDGGMEVPIGRSYQEQVEKVLIGG